MEVKNATVPALERALNIIEYLANANHPVSLKTLSEHLDIPTASAFRLIKNLVNRGYVQELSGGQATYLFGGQITALAMVHERGNSLYAKAAPIMDQLANTLEQTVQLGVMKNETLQYIGQASSYSPDNVSVVAPLYTPLNIHTSAAGKILFSYLTPEQQSRCLQQMAFVPATEYTITTPQAFLAETRHSRARGYSVDNEEYAIGIGCLSVPVFTRDACTAALGITGSISKYRDAETFSTMLKALQQASEQLSQSLFFL